VARAAGDLQRPSTSSTRWRQATGEPTAWPTGRHSARLRDWATPWRLAVRPGLSVRSAEARCAQPRRMAPAVVSTMTLPVSSRMTPRTTTGERGSRAHALRPAARRLTATTAAKGTAPAAQPTTTATTAASWARSTPASLGACPLIRCTWLRVNGTDVAGIDWSALQERARLEAAWLERVVEPLHDEEPVDIKPVVNQTRAIDRYVTDPDTPAFYGRFDAVSLRTSPPPGGRASTPRAGGT
jgi:hypothetical protein